MYPVKHERPASEPAKGNVFRVRRLEQGSVGESGAEGPKGRRAEGPKGRRVVKHHKFEIEQGL